MRAIPIIPMLPAKEVSAVLPFFVIKFLRDSPKEVLRDMEGFLTFFSRSVLTLSSSCSFFISSSERGAESSVISPSSMRTMRVEYFSARLGLCVTIITSLSLDISFNISITCRLVSVSSAPVGSSASTISGLFTIARAMATRCICPPDISLGFFLSWEPSPTCSRAFLARLRRSDLPTPERVRASSTFCSTV